MIIINIINTKTNLSRFINNIAANLFKIPGTISSNSNSNSNSISKMLNSVPNIKGTFVYHAAKSINFQPNWSWLTFIQHLNNLIGASKNNLNNNKYTWIVNNTLLFCGKIENSNKTNYEIINKNNFSLLPLAISIKNNKINLLQDYNKYNLKYKIKDSSKNSINLNNKEIYESFSNYIVNNDAVDVGSSAAFGMFNSCDRKMAFNTLRVDLLSNNVTLPEYVIKYLSDLFYSPKYSANIKVKKNISDTYSIIDGGYNDNTSIASLLLNIIKNENITINNCSKSIINLTSLLNTNSTYEQINLKASTIDEYLLNWKDICTPLYNILSNNTNKAILGIHSNLNNYILKPLEIYVETGKIGNFWIQKINISAISQYNKIYSIIGGIDVNMTIILVGLPNVGLLISEHNKQYYDDFIDKFYELYKTVTLTL